MDLSFISNAAIAALVGSGIIGIFIVYLINLIFSDVNIDKMMKEIDRITDDLVKSDSRIGEETKKKLRYAATSLLNALEE